MGKASKIIKVVFITVTVLFFIVFIAGLIFIKTFDVMRFKPQIIDQASKSLGREVNFDKAKLGISLTRGISLKIDNLAIKDDINFSKDDFFKAKEISLGINVLEFIFHKKIDVPNVLIDSCRINIIRTKDGLINAATIAAASSTAPGNNAMAIPALLISSIKINNGFVNYTDHAIEPAISVDVAKINIRVTDFSLINDFAVKAEAAVLSEETNANLTGKARLSLKEGAADLSGKFDFTVTKAKLKGVNLLRLILDKISVIPGLSEQVEAGLSEKYKNKLVSDDTELSDVKIPFEIKNSQLISGDAVFGAEGFDFKGEAKVGFDASYTLKGSLIVEQELSNAMISAVEQLQYLLNENKQVFIPLKVSGAGDKYKIEPDLEYIAKKIVVNQVKNKIFEAIEKASGAGGSTDNSQEKPSQDMEKTFKGLLQGIFDEKK